MIVAASIAFYLLSMAFCYHELRQAYLTIWLHTHPDVTDIIFMLTPIINFFVALGILLTIKNSSKKGPRILDRFFRIRSRDE